MKNTIFLITSIMILFIMTGCTQKFQKINNVSKANLEQVDWDEIDGFESDDLQTALKVFQKDCKRSKRKAIFKNVCEEANIANDSSEFFMKNFTPYKLYNDNGTDEGVITGYYEPLLYGSLTKSDKYQYPVYKTPKDLITVSLSKIYPELKGYRLRGKVINNRLIPYDARETIKENENTEIICYVDNKVDLFFLQIQGSGKVQLDSGEIINVGYSNQNGRKYNSVGKYMMKQGYIGNKIPASTQGMKMWFEQNPSEVDRVLNQNESYIFFRQSQQGATGSLGTELVAKRNIAVDTRYIPLGMPVFINTKNPLTGEKIEQLMVAADTGGAIKGEIRADFFWGFAKEAEKYAGRMKEKGKLYILIPNI